MVSVHGHDATKSDRQWLVLQTPRGHAGMGKGNRGREMRVWGETEGIRSVFFLFVGKTQCGKTDYWSTGFLLAAKKFVGVCVGCVVSLSPRLPSLGPQSESYIFYI